MGTPEENFVDKKPFSTSRFDRFFERVMLIFHCKIKEIKQERL